MSTNPQSEVIRNGLAAIRAVFAHARREHRAAFMPFFTVGYPDLDTSLQMIESLIMAGADIVEIGIPFSDPVADGPTIQHASHIAVHNGTRVQDCLNVVRALRSKGITTPFILMGYLNPIMSYGIERYIEDASEAGANGFIVVDMPPEESANFLQLCQARGMALIPLIAPTSSPDRIRQVSANADGFIYVVSVAGVTGARDALPIDLQDYIRRVRSLSTQPLVVGFGISSPTQAHQVAQIADGVVVASALMNTFAKHGAQAAQDLAAQLRAACQR